MRYDYESFYLDCWLGFEDVTNKKWDDLPYEVQSRLDRVISEANSFDESVDNTIDRMIKECDDDIENDNWLKGLQDIGLTPKEYSNN
jgi:hypothetical protein